MTDVEYQGQLWGGPQHGNLISATVEKVYFNCLEALWLDGIAAKPSRNTIAGAYNWNEGQGRFDWEGPGADGDTMERLRLG